MPTIDPTIGPLGSPWDVEQAFVATLSLWVPWYLYRFEAYAGIQPGQLPRPPVPESFAGGSDFDSVQRDWLPAVIVVVTPFGAPEYAGNGDYSQEYEVQVGAVVELEDETSTRRLANYYGAIAMTSIVQQAPAGIDRLKMTGSPTIFFPSPDSRRDARSVSTYRCFVSSIVNDQLGPSTYPEGYPPGPPSPPESPLPPWTEITVVETDVVGDPLP